MKTTESLRQDIAALVKEYAALQYAEKKFIPGTTVVPPSGKVMGESELQYMVEASLDGWLTTGRFNEQFEKELAEFIGIKHLISVNSGSSANLVAFATLTSPKLGERAIQKGDEVIAVAAGFPTTVNPIIQFGAIPVFVDVEEDTFNLDPYKLEEAITNKTKALIVVSLYGQTPDFDTINEIAQKHNLPVIEDAAQSLGASYKGKMSCNLTVIGTTSFFPSKPLGCYGDGGACFTNDEGLNKKMRAIKNHGGLVRFQHDYIGLNGRIDTMQAAIILVKFNHFKETLKKRNNVAHMYSDKLKDVDNIKLPVTKNTNYHVWAQYSILVKDKEERDALVSYMKDNGVNVAIFYPVPLHYQPCFKGKSRCHDLSVTENVCDRIMNLPCYGEFTEEEVNYVVSTFKNYFLNKS